MQTIIDETCTNRYVFDKETETKLKKLGLMPTSIVGQYRNENHTVYVYAQANDKYYLSIECDKLANESYEKFLIKLNQLTSFTIIINDIMK